MKIVVLHSPTRSSRRSIPCSTSCEARTAGGPRRERLVVDRRRWSRSSALRRAAPELVFNLAESFAGKSALDSNVAALLNLLDLRYTGSSPAGLLLAGDKSLTQEGAAISRRSDAGFADAVSRRGGLGGRHDFPAHREAAAGRCIARYQPRRWFTT